MRRVPLDWSHPFYVNRVGVYTLKPLSEETMQSMFKAPAIGYQLYETATKGTPVSPVFETYQKLIDYLVRSKTPMIGRHPGSKKDWEELLQ